MGAAHLAFTAGVAGGASAIGDAKHGKNGGCGADGGDEPAVFPCELHGFQRLRAALDGRNALHPAGENDHIQLGQVHLAKFHIGGHGDAVASDDDLSANAHGGDGHARAAQQINRGDGFRFLEAGSKQHVNHIQSSRHAATWR